MSLPQNRELPSDYEITSEDIARMHSPRFEQDIFRAATTEQSPPPDMRGRYHRAREGHFPEQRWGDRVSDAQIFDEIMR